MKIPQTRKELQREVEYLKEAIFYRDREVEDLKNYIQRLEGVCEGLRQAHSRTTESIANSVALFQRPLILTGPSERVEI
jgi:predicted  nucleic acid-binding Zn-ribbon protein